MKIGIDARILIASVTGIGRYVLEMGEALARAGHELVFYLPNDLHPTVLARPAARFVVSRATSGIGRLLWGATVLPSKARQDGVDAFWGPSHRLPARLDPDIGRVVTIHDLVWVRVPQTMRRRGLITDWLTMPRAVAMADRVAATSQSTANDIISVFPGSREKTRVVPLGLTHFPAADPSVLRRHRIDRPFALFVGTLAPRKNLFGLLAAFAALPPAIRAANRLVIAGGRGWRLSDIGEEITRLGLENEVHYVGRVSDAQLAALYQAARFLALPSFYEGFGIPIVEANAAGVPTLVSANSSMPEIGGSAAFLVDPYDVSSITAGLATMFTDDRAHARLAAAAKTNAARFSWDASAAALAGLLAEASAERAGVLRPLAPSRAT